LTPKDVAKTQMGVGVGDRISFSHEGRTLEGTINRISKRATILVPSHDSHQGTLYSDGKRYFKFYVPLGRLRASK
jgi:hypothetical protein